MANQEANQPKLEPSEALEIATRGYTDLQHLYEEGLITEEVYKEQHEEARKQLRETYKTATGRPAPDDFVQS